MAYPYGRDYYGRGPSPWVPATILGVILLIATTPFRMAPDAAAAMAYQPAPMPSGFPSALIWIPILFFFAAQFVGGSRHRPYYRNERFPYGRIGMSVGEYYPEAGSDNYNQYNDPYNTTYMSSFMDYGGHWMLILIGIWLFSLIGSGPVGGRRVGFPWSLFSPQPQIVLPMV